MPVVPKFKGANPIAAIGGLSGGAMGLIGAHAGAQGGRLRSGGLAGILNPKPTGPAGPTAPEGPAASPGRPSFAARLRVGAPADPTSATTGFGGGGLVGSTAGTLASRLSGLNKGQGNAPGSHEQLQAILGPDYEAKIQQLLPLLQEGLF